MKKNTLLYTNILICIIITLGFITTSVVAYHSNNSIFEQEAEHVSSLACEGIYYRIDQILSEPVHVSLTMANDSLLKSTLSKENQHLDEDSYTEELGNYLLAYKEKYAYDSVFLVSALTNRYYHFNGIDRVLTEGDPENEWYYEFLNQKDEYALNVDNDEAGDDSITVFVNCKIKDENGVLLGIIGVGMKVDSLQSLLRDYNKKFALNAFLVDEKGILQLSSDKTGYEREAFFSNDSLKEYQDLVKDQAYGQQTFWHTSGAAKSYVVMQYVESLKWQLIIENDMTAVSGHLKVQLYTGITVIVIIIIFVLCMINRVLRKYKNQVIKLSASQRTEYQTLLNQAVKGMYEYIFEIDITHNRAKGESGEKYFAELGIAKDTPYDQALYIIAEKKVKEEYRQGYLDTFLPDRVLQCYGRGISNLSYDFIDVGEDGTYHWIRNTGRIFYWTRDESVHMISYHQNIDEEKKRELYLLEKTKKDSMTGLLNKGAAEDAMAAFVAEGRREEDKHALLILDLDDFKNVNDKYGHAFGDQVLKEFAMELTSNFRDHDVIGRIGGDEFAVLMVHCSHITVLCEKLERFCAKILQKDFGEQKNAPISCSVGAALYPEHGSSYAELYENADKALYYAKSHGKSSYHILDETYYNSTSSYLETRDLRTILEYATDGIAKVAVCSPFKILHYNQKMGDILGGREKPELDVNMDVFECIYPEDLPEIHKTLEACMPKRESAVLTVRLHHAEGHDMKAKLHIIVVNEQYQEHYPVFYAVYTNVSNNM